MRREGSAASSGLRVLPAPAVLRTPGLVGQGHAAQPALTASGALPKAPAALRVPLPVPSDTVQAPARQGGAGPQGAMNPHTPSCSQASRCPDAETLARPTFRDKSLPTCWTSRLDHLLPETKEQPSFGIKKKKSTLVTIHAAIFLVSSQPPSKALRRNSRPQRPR